MEGYTVAPFGEGLWIINDGHVRLFLVEGAKQALLVDTGFGNGDLPALLAKYTKRPITVLNTHADGDHTGGNRFFSQILLHPAEFALYRNSATSQAVELLPIQDGDRIDLGGRELTVVHIPGHTPGSIALLDSGRRLMLSGDSVQEGPIYMFGPARSVEALRVSLRRLEKISTQVDAILPSHNRLPVDAGMICDLIDGADRLLSGQLEAQDAGMPGRDCKKYTSGRISFYY